MTRYGMAIDTKRCFGCETCVMACKVANNLPKDVLYNRIHAIGGDHLDMAAGEWPNLTLSYHPTACQHCDNPSCMHVCPTGATQSATTASYGSIPTFASGAGRASWHVLTRACAR